MSWFKDGKISEKDAPLRKSHPGEYLLSVSIQLSLLLALIRFIIAMMQRTHFHADEYFLLRESRGRYL